MTLSEFFLSLKSSESRASDSTAKRTVMEDRGTSESPCTLATEQRFCPRIAVRPGMPSLTSRARWRPARTSPVTAPRRRRSCRTDKLEERGFCASNQKRGSSLLLLLRLTPHDIIDTFSKRPLDVDEHQSEVLVERASPFCRGLPWRLVVVVVVVVVDDVVQPVGGVGRCRRRCCC